MKKKNEGKEQKMSTKEHKGLLDKANVKVKY